MPTQEHIQVPYPAFLRVQTALQDAYELLEDAAAAHYTHDAHNCGHPTHEPFDLDAMVETAKLTTSLFIDRIAHMHRDELRYSFANQKILERRRWDELFKELRPARQPRVEVRLYGGGGAGGSADYNPFAPITGAGGNGGSSPSGAGDSGRFITTNFDAKADAFYYAIATATATANDSRGPIHAAVPVFNPAHSYNIGDKVLIDGELHEVTQAHGGVYNYNRVETDAFGNQTVVSRGTAAKSPEPQVETPSSAPAEPNSWSWDYDSTFGDYDD